jgi:prepilin-type processing-associated H-X9-DG protein
MVAWEDNFTDGCLPGFMSAHGETATYGYADGSADATVTVYVEELAAVIDQKFYAWVGVAQADVPAPIEGDRLTINGVAWDVTEARDMRDGMWNLRCFAPKLRP